MSQSSNKVPQEQWDRYKPMLWELWKQKGMTTAKIVQLMPQRYGFNADKNAFDRQFKAWGWHKNMTAEAWCVIEHHMKKRKRDHNKDSQVKFNGFEIAVTQRAKRHRLTYVEELQVLQRYGDALPDSITVSTPVNVDSDYISVEDLPWNEFLRNTQVSLDQYGSGLVDGFLQLTNAGLPLHAAGFIHSAVLQSITAFPGTTVSLPTFMKPLEKLVFCIANGHDQQYWDRDLKYWRSSADDFLDFLQMQPDLRFLEIFQSISGPTKEAFAMALISTAFERDDVRIAKILLRICQVDIHNPVKRCIRSKVFLVDLIQSSAMAKLYTKYGGDLTTAILPFLRLSHSSLVSTEVEALYEQLILSSHPDVSNSLVEIMQTHSKPLVLLALQTSSFTQLQIGMGIVESFSRSSMKEIQNLLVTRMEPGWATTIGGKLLAFSAARGHSKAIQQLLSKTKDWTEVVEEREIVIEAHKWDRKQMPWARFAAYRSGFIIGDALQQAVFHEQTDVIKEILTAVLQRDDVPDQFPCEPLHLALLTGDIDLAHTLLDAGASVRNLALADKYPAKIKTKTRSQYYSHPLTLAVNLGDLKLLKRLIADGLDSNTAVPRPQNHWETPLIVAFQKGQYSLAKTLLESGAKLSVPAMEAPEGIEFITALVDAIRYDQFELVKSYILYPEDVNGHSTQPEIGGVLDSSDFETPLSAAMCSEYCHDLAQELVVSFGAELDIPLYDVINSEPICWDCMRLALHGSESDITDLLEEAEDLSLADLEKISHIFFCGTEHCYPGDSTCGISNSMTHSWKRFLGIQALYHEYGRDSDTAEDESVYNRLLPLWLDYESPCMVTVLKKANSYDSIVFLLNAGLLPIDRSVNSHYKCCGDTIYTWGWEQVIEELASRSKSSSRVQSQEDNGILDEGLDLLRRLASLGANLHEPAQEVYSRTALQAAAGEGWLQGVRYLLQDYGASPNEPPAKKGGATALQAAAIEGHISIAYELLNAGADVNAAAAPINGWTALEAAAITGRLDMVQLLIDAGADISDSIFGARQYKSAVGGARREGFSVVARLLERNRAEKHPLLEVTVDTETDRQ